MSVTTIPPENGRESASEILDPREVAISVIVVGLVIIWAIWWYAWFPALRTADATTYVAAAERLNAGHPLYAIGPGDRPIDWPIPLLSPPLIAVVLRPLAAISFGLDLWWIMTAATLVATLALLGRNARGASGVALLSWAAGLELIEANLNTWILAGLVLVWAFRRDDRVWAVVGVLAVAKLAPAIAALWLVRTRRVRALVWVAAGAGLAAVVSFFGAGVGNVVAYIPIATSIAPANPLANLWAGLPTAILVAGSLASLILRPRWSWVAIIAAMVLGSPVLNLSTFVVLAAGLAPFISRR